MVTSVQAGFPAELAEIKPGDIIRKIDGKPVEDLEALGLKYDELVAAGTEQVLLDVQRGRGLRSTLLKIKK